MSDFAAPRTTDARSPDEVAQVVRARKGRPTAWWGMAMFVASEGTLLAMMTGSYFYLRFKNLHWPPPGIPKPELAVPLVLLATLVVTSAPMQLAFRAARDGLVDRARWLVLLALVLQIDYLAIAMSRYVNDLHSFTPQQHAYGSIYYALLGADHAHVAVGILFNLWLIAKLLRGLTTYRVNALQAISFYWHAVNTLTIVITLTILSPSL